MLPIRNFVNSLIILKIKLLVNNWIYGTPIVYPFIHKTGKFFNVNVFIF
jgi:hypothetical protein